MTCSRTCAARSAPAEALPCRREAYDAGAGVSGLLGRAVFYMVERGPGPARSIRLLEQAAASGSGHFNSRLERLPGPASRHRAQGGGRDRRRLPLRHRHGRWFGSSATTNWPEGYAYLLVTRPRHDKTMFPGSSGSSTSSHGGRVPAPGDLRMKILMRMEDRQFSPAGDALSGAIRLPASRRVSGHAVWIRHGIAIRSGCSPRALLRAATTTCGNEICDPCSPPRWSTALYGRGNRGYRLAAVAVGPRRALVPRGPLPGFMACAAVASLGAAALSQRAARRELQPRELRMRLVPLRRRLSGPSPL